MAEPLEIQLRKMHDIVRFSEDADSLSETMNHLNEVIDRYNSAEKIHLEDIAKKEKIRKMSTAN